MRFDWSQIPDADFRQYTNKTLGEMYAIRPDTVRVERNRRLAAGQDVTGPDGRGGNRPTLGDGEPSVLLSQARVPASLEQAVQDVADARGVSKSQVIRDCLLNSKEIQRAIKARSKGC